MFNNIFQTTLTCASIITYIFSLVLVFNTTLSTKQIETLLFGSHYNEQPLLLFSSIIVLLILPDLIAIISYGHARKNNPEVNQQTSAGFRILVDLILVGLIICSLHDRLFVPISGYTPNLYTFDVRLYMGGALALAAASLALFQPFHFLRNIRSEGETKDYLRSLLDKPPYINFHVHAYHYEWRTRWVTETHTDSRGRTETTRRPERYREQVTTLRQSIPYTIPSWRDATNQQALLAPQSFPITKIKILTTIQPADADARQHFSEAWSGFCDKYKNADTQVNFSTTQGVSGIGPVLLLSFLAPKERSMFLNAFACFWIVLTPFAWGYSLWLDQISSAGEKTISKEFFLP